MQILEIIPAASALVQSLRGLGYSPESALADLIDNSIAAGATCVDVDVVWDAGDVRVQILDDGRGMTFQGLADAMRFGGSGPGVPRAGEDLGRFGLGLKTASLSQCRRLTVATRRDGGAACMAWDIDEVERTGRWDVFLPEAPPPSALALRLDAMAHGTLVVWDRMDELGGLFGLDKAALFLRIADIRAHFAMVFHRFLSGDARRLVVRVNGRAVKGWDPFQRSHPATRALPPERRRAGGATVTVSPFVLPHRDRFENDLAFAEAGGVGGWGERQGFYVYRGKRLVVAGGWLGLGGSRAWTRDEASRLARIAVDLPTDVDASWRVDIRKSLARPPAAFRPRLTALATGCRDAAREVFAWRGGSARRQPAKATEAMWTADYAGGTARYRINRTHPALAAAFSASGLQGRQLGAALSIIERTVPVEQIWLDVSENAERNPEIPAAEEAVFCQDLAALIAGMRDARSHEQRTDDLLRPLRIDSPALRARILALLDAAT